MNDPDDATLAKIASHSQQRMDTRSMPAPLKAAIQRAIATVPPPDSSRPPTPSTPPSSDPGARNRALLAQAWETVPTRFRWARFDSPKLAEYVRLPVGVITALRDQAPKPAVSTMLIGATGAGKTTLACAFMREVLDLALEASEARCRESDQLRERSHLAPLAPWDPVDLARFKRGIHSRFVAAYELARAADEAPLGVEPRALHKARRAALLVLDDLGMDAGHRRRDVVRDLIHERHAQGRPTIITTYLTRKDIIAHYGAGIRRRLAEGVVLTLGA